jgi:hypothetical protein
MLVTPTARRIFRAKLHERSEDARIVTDAAAVFTEAHITDIMLAIVNAPMPTHRLSIGLRTDRGRAVAHI